MEKEQIGIIGAGAWGTALANTIALNGHKILMYAPEADVIKAINKSHENQNYLPGVALSELITISDDINDLPEQCKTIFITCPATANTEVATLIGSQLTAEHTIIIGSKGFRESDGALMSEVWQEAVPKLQNIAVLSGPIFAIELAQQKPGSIVVTAKSDAVRNNIANILQVDFLRVYFNDDLIGAQIGGALKNTIAVACGMSDQLELGNNARSSFICRGMVEIKRYATALGAKPETIDGLSGLGDVLLTSTSPMSKGYRLGQLIAKGISPEEAMEIEPAGTEIFRATRIVIEKASSQGLDLGVIVAIDGILHGDISPNDVIKLLLCRPTTWEYE